MRSADRADEAEFLGERGEDEVGVLLGQEVQPRLGALHEAAPREAARAHGDLGLGDVVAGAQRVGVGIEEGEDAAELVVLDAAASRCRATSMTAVTRPTALAMRGGEVPEADAGEEHHRAGAGKQQDRRAEVRLLQDQRQRARAVRTSGRTSQNGRETLAGSSRS